MGWGRFVLVFWTAACSPSPNMPWLPPAWWGMHTKHQLPTFSTCLSPSLPQNLSPTWPIHIPISPALPPYGCDLHPAQPRRGLLPPGTSQHLAGPCISGLSFCSVECKARGNRAHTQNPSTVNWKCKLEAIALSSGTHVVLAFISGLTTLWVKHPVAFSLCDYCPLPLISPKFSHFHHYSLQRTGCQRISLEPL